ncbi:alpha/beta fold hydrolase [Labedaea rhizosphaerae]|uniref:Haloacetate dehalogenase n=1 Tax=Labedaea rhizosphaerae TaxID=598644 RepID=A0A4R6RQ58_LABRH|nr:alpha/beta hydrolase [Labedaea rhizosphaerae]TDP88903.1 haloacetate dehalogenase [Labedaea rhizosphaerae]
MLGAPFRYQRVEVDGVGINAAVAGTGPPLLLLHGYPQTHLIWRHVAPVLAAHHTVVLTDLRGYGDSDKPAPDPGDVRYSKRAMARDQFGVMHELGFDRFTVIGHDRGARVAHRLALDHADAVAAVALLDIVPTRHLLNHVTRAMSLGYFHWFFLAAGDIPERLLAGNMDFWVRAMIERLLAPGTTIEPEVMADYIRCMSSPAAIAATTADYRAATTTDLADDDAGMAAGAKLRCPTLVLWGEKSFVGRNYAPLEVWSGYSENVRGTALPCGHFLPEEAPSPTAGLLLSFVDETW